MSAVLQASKSQSLASPSWHLAPVCLVNIFPYHKWWWTLDFGDGLFFFFFSFFTFAVNISCLRIPPYMMCEAGSLCLLFFTFSFFPSIQNIDAIRKMNNEMRHEREKAKVIRAFFSTSIYVRSFDRKDR